MQTERAQETSNETGPETASGRSDTSFAKATDAEFAFTDDEDWKERDSNHDFDWLS